MEREFSCFTLLRVLREKVISWSISLAGNRSTPQKNSYKCTQNLVIWEPFAISFQELAFIWLHANENGLTFQLMGMRFKVEAVEDLSRKESIHLGHYLLKVCNFYQRIFLREFGISIHHFFHSTAFNWLKEIYFNTNRNDLNLLQVFQIEFLSFCTTNVITEKVSSWR